MASYVSNNIYEARTAGGSAGQIKSTQSWKIKKTNISQQIAQRQPTKENILHDLEKAAHGQVGVFKKKIDHSLAYTNPSHKIDILAKGTDNESFHFSDVIDVINPLHHLPVIGTVYRQMTGDQLHPMSQIIGGAIYGGPVGAVTGTVNAITKIQTGKDLGDHALNFAGIGQPQKEDFIEVVGDKNNPIKQLNNTTMALKNNQPLQDFPASALSFVNLSEMHHAHHQIKVASGRTAGHRLESYSQDLNNITTKQPVLNTPLQAQEIATSQLPKHEKITQVSLSAMPPKRGG